MSLEHDPSTAGAPAAPPEPESREYCFLIISYKQEYDPVSAQLRQLVQERIGIRCVRADHNPQPDHDLLGKVHDMILGASVVVADVSEPSPNVFYEYGYASAHDRRPVLIARADKEPPTDLRGKEALR
jgi:hypothetical protein